MRRELLLCCLFVFFVTSPAVHALGFGDNVEGFRFLLPEMEVEPGESIEITVQGAHEESIQGFTMAARYPSEYLTIQRIHTTDTLLDAIGTDFFTVVVDPDEHYLTVNVLVDTAPPFEGALIPYIGIPMDFFYIEAVVSEDAIGSLEIALEDGLGFPPLANVFVIDNLPQPLTELTTGALSILEPEPEKAFLRGDVNLDWGRDLSDAVRILDHQFLGAPVPACLDAADTNDDQAVDLSDPVYLLAFLFTGASAPPSPTAEPGPDPTSDELDCEFPLYYMSE